MGYLPLDFHESFSPCFSILCEHFCCSRLPAVGTLRERWSTVGVALLSWIPGGGLRERAHIACHRTRVHGARSALSPALRTPGHCSGAALASAAARHRSYLPILLALVVNGPEVSGLLISSALSCTGKCGVGQAHAVAYVIACLWQVLFRFDFKRWQLWICCDRWQPSTALVQPHSWDRKAMRPNMFCKVYDRPRHRVPRRVERRSTRQLAPGLQSWHSCKEHDIEQTT